MTLWALMPLLRAQISRVTLYDVLVLVLAAVLFWRRLRAWRGASTQSAGRGFYLLYLGMLCGGLASGLAADDLSLWLFELSSWSYLGLMMWTLDQFSRGRFARFLRLGAWTFAVISLVTGLVASLQLLGIYKWELFWDLNRKNQSVRFIGLTRYANQWSGYCVMMFPLLLAYGSSARQRWKRWFLLGSGLLGFMSVLASGSRSGTFLFLAEIAGFVPLYLMLNRSGKLLGRLLLLLALLSTLIAGWALLAEDVNESPIARRSLGALWLVEEGEFSDDWRDYNREAAWHEFTRSPLLGLGLGNFERLYDLHEVHSSYVSVLAEAGLLAFVPYCLLLLLICGKLVQALLVSVAHRKIEPVVLALCLILVSALSFGVHHNTLRQRYIWSMYLCCLLYGRDFLLGMRLELAQRRHQRRQHTQQRLALGRPLKDPRPTGTSGPAGAPDLGLWRAPRRG